MVKNVNKIRRKWREEKNYTKLSRQECILWVYCFLDDLKLTNKKCGKWQNIEMHMYFDDNTMYDAIVQKGDIQPSNKAHEMNIIQVWKKRNRMRMSNASTLSAHFDRSNDIEERGHTQSNKIADSLH